MDVAAGADIRLGLLLALNALVFAAALWFAARTIAGDWIDRAADASLLFFLVQYLSVCLPGLAGVLNPLTMAGAAIVCCVLLVAASARRGRPAPAPAGAAASATPAGWVPIACFAFAVGYVLALAVYYRHLPVLASDALTYHFPAAATWLRTGRLALFETWFFNPANTYSPLAGSAFIAWLLAPLGNDVLAVYVQVPPLLMLWLIATRLARQVGVSTPLAALAATALVVSQPFLRASILSKDDLFAAAFFTAALASLSPRVASDRLGAWRLGVAAGLFLATKYTTLLALPILLLALDGPRKAGWTVRRWVLALALAFALAAPWYLRNLVTTGNPLFPVSLPSLPGLFSTETSPRLRSLSGIWRTFTGVDDAMPAVVLLPILAAWIAWLATRGRTLLRDPLSRAVAFGPIIGVALFLWRAPYAEIRFLYPVLTLWLVATAAAVTSVRPAILAWLLAILIAGLSLATGLPFSHAVLLSPAGFITAAAAGGGWLLLRRTRLDWTHAALGNVLAVAALAVGVYVYWPAYVRHTAALATPAWEAKYGPDLTAAWSFVRTQLPPDAKLAYANTFLVYPLMGFEPTRPVEYIPTRAGVTRLADLPPLGPVTGDDMERRIADATLADPDEPAWLDRLVRSNARFLFVQVRPNLAPHPPELAFAAGRPDRFRPIFSNPAAVIFEILPPTMPQ